LINGDKQLFESEGKTTTLKCDFKNSSWTYVIGNKCSGSLEITNSGTVVDKVSYQKGDCLKNVKIISVVSQNVNFMPKGLTKKFQQIEATEISLLLLICFIITSLHG
jgi:hypothetical protein